ncbi:hypothetical protein IFM89_038500 [Coptis chinensis]|uniref:F-box domain-containing protein n=1 Tax=Coptis chinensis TaxID=261450 RepID=A0A835MK62_9MAGN|nr:hypothetical protein IFM89_038500 [Coptis chinensis]
MTILNKKTWASVVRDGGKRPLDDVKNLNQAEEGLMLFCDDIMSSILTKLPIESLLRSSCVCKRWRNLIQESHFINMQVNKSLQSPRFVLVDESRVWILDREVKARIPIETWKTREIILGKDLKVVYIAAAYHSYLCLCRYDDCDHISIYNPITKECIKLPTPNYSLMKSNIGLGFDGISKKYKVVRSYDDVFSDFLHTMKCEILTLGENSWRKVYPPCQVKSTKPLFVDGGFHWVMHKVINPDLGEILTLDIASESFQTIKITSSVRQPDAASNGRLELINIGESLALVEARTSCIHVWQLVDRKTTGYSVYQHTTHDVSTINKTFITAAYKLVGMMSNGNFLFQLHHFPLYHPCYCGDDWCEEDYAEDSYDYKQKARFVQYFPQEKKFRLIHAPDVPDNFLTYFFTPNLGSLNALTELP